MAHKHSNKERFMLFQAGWRCGARSGVKDVLKAGDPHYENGYREGRTAYSAAMELAFISFPHDRSILREEKTDD